MSAQDVLLELGLAGSAYAAPVAGGPGAGFGEHQLVTPASVMKIQIGLAVENLIAAGTVDGAAPRVVPPGRRTPGPVGMSLMQDEVTMSVRDLVTAMLTISDNVATDELIAVAGLAEINRCTRALGLPRTLITSDLSQLLDGIAGAAGFGDFAALTSHSPAADGPPTEADMVRRIEQSAALDPARGPRTTAFETVSLLQAIWTDRAGPPQACQRVRAHLASQLTRHRIASGFDSSVSVAAKSGGLLGVVRNEAGVVVWPGGVAFAVAVFTRKEHGNATDPARIDRAIGQIARLLVDELHDGQHDVRGR